MEGSTLTNIGIMETSVDSRQNVLTANSSTIYAVHPVNLEEYGGAMVLEVPQKMMGMVNGAGWTIVADIGFTGLDKGKGGKYLITSPRYKGATPKGYHHFKSDTKHCRLASSEVLLKITIGPATVRHMKKGIKIYALKDAANPPKTTFYNTSESTTVNNKNMDMLYLPKDVFALIRQYFEENYGLGHEKHAYIRGHFIRLRVFLKRVSFLQKTYEKAWTVANDRQTTLTFNNRSKTSHKWGEDNMWQWAQQCCR